MDILSLDLARRVGWARGTAGKTPDSGSFELGAPGGNVGLLAGELARRLVQMRRDRGVPDLVIVERWIPLRASVNDRSVEVALRLNGACHAILGGIYNVLIVEPAAATIRAAVCGKANAGTRAETKAMVVHSVVLRGLLPKNSVDDDRADALAGWVWAESVYGKTAPKNFALS